MFLWIFLIIPIVQVTPLIAPKAIDLSSMTSFISQTRSRIRTPDPTYTRKPRLFSKYISHLSCRFHEASEKLESMDNLVNKNGNLYDNFGDSLNIGNNEPIRKIQRNVERINKLHAQFLDNWAQSDVEKLRHYLPKIIEASSNYVPALLEEIYRLIAPSACADNGYGRIAEKGKTLSKELCGMSIELSFLQLHTDIVRIELLGYIMGIYAYALKSAIKQKSYTMEMDRLAIRTTSRLTEYLNAIKSTASETPDIFFNCEHRGHHTRESTYIDFQGLMQGYLVSQDDIASENNCYDGCNDIPAFSKVHRKNDNTNPGIYDRNTPCTGQVAGCTFFGWNVDVCYGEPNSGRRYNSLKYESALYGKNQCSTPKTEQWHRNGIHSCEQCYCICTDDGINSKATRTISLQWSTADYESNKVVIGMRFILKNNVMRLQAYEGKLLEGGEIEAGSERWVPMDDFTYRPEDELGAYYVQSRKLTRGTDFMFVGTGTYRFVVDDLTVAPGRAIIAIRFSYKPTEGFSVEAKSVPINVVTGEVGKLQPHELPDVVHNVPHRAVAGVPNGRPIDFQNNVLRRTYDGQIVFLFSSSAESDAGQSTIPFFDAREIIANFPISGIGIAYRNDEEERSGGFLVPTLKTYDYRQDVRVDKKEWLVLE